MLKVLFFAQLREVLNTDSLELASQATVAELRAVLMTKGEIWKEYLASDSCLVAVNQTMASDKSALKDGDEVAFFPPVTGG